MAAILGKKIGMTQLFTEEGESVPVTVIEATPNRVTAVRSADADGYTAVQLGFGELAERKLTKAKLGHLKKTDSPPLRHLVEFRDPDGDFELGGEVTVAAFEPGQKVKVSAVSIGKGFQGTVKRHNFSRGPVSHGSHNVRAPGSIGASADPARVFKGRKMPGRMGGKRITQRGLEVIRVDADSNLLMLRGSIPGPKKGLVEVRTDG
jgi:large subunit ribosomal protein L3